MQFTKLRLTGFKSFVDAAEVPIEVGLTGVVGPNGCGKSNLVEALKWVMGETSAKQMRGGEMDDVIFGGTSNRPARNLAEVTVVLDNGGRTAPAMFNEFPELEVTRRIERGSGSLYRVNGKDVRARDVQLLFADAATGARSTALVSQGRVGILINAKPSERRSLLEEAAGIGGLHSRRHEAEIRLRGAETNLDRLTDVLTALDGQLQNLKKQARQAARYRALSDQIRKAEAVVLHLGWVAAIRSVEEARLRLADAESRVAGLTGGAAAAATAQADAATSLPALRQEEVEAAARLQRLVLAREQLDAEAGRIASARRESETRLAQIAADIAREDARATDADQASARLEAERSDLEAAAVDEGSARESATVHLREVGAEVNAVEAELARLTEVVAAAEARRAEAARRLEELTGRANRLAARVGELESNRATLAAAAVPAEDLAAAGERVAMAESRLDAGRDAIDAAELARADAQAAFDLSRDALSRDSAARAKLAAETSALEEMLAEGVEGDWSALIDEVVVAPGYEAAVAAALGDDLLASVEAEAPRHWSELPPLDNPPPLPDSAEPLARRVTAPAALARRLGQVGLVTSGAAGKRVWPTLAQGQRVVTRDGGLWRWDGFTVAAGAPSNAATRLRQRNRLADLEIELAEADSRVEDAARRADEARDATTAATAAERRARDDARTAEAALGTARDVLARLEQKAAAADSRLAAVDDSLTAGRADLAEAEAALAKGRDEAERAEEPSEGRSRLAELRAQVAEKRSALVEARAAYDHLAREAEARRRRLDAIAGDVRSWRERGDAARLQRHELDERRETVADKLERLAARPLEMEGQRRTLLDQTQAAEVARRGAADRLAQAETVLGEADRRLRDAEQVLAAAREDRVRFEAAVEQGRGECRAVAARIAERLDCAPEQVAALAEVADGGGLPDAEDAERRLDRLARERETMGPVNLRAEQEAADLEQQIATLQGERDDLIAAIARLRQGIAEINREGRERLLASFQAVDRHFRTLFERLFGGGRAHLTLTESDDPLQAGLEIMASPPGKRLQILSLLSGGEQALTALALLFAVFLTNPAPVCVLDEVDAPLDDANVDRFCTMLAEIAGVSATRFLVVTHHRLTMARMDRLFGVTMGERGVSQLVSVDLRRAEALRDSA